MGRLSFCALKLPPIAVLVLFCLVNCVSYVDRGVIPGAFDPLGSYIRTTLNVDTADSYIGYLQSSFIVGYSIASLMMGHLVHRFPPFKLMSIGLFLWVLAVVGCGLAPNFWFLLVARMVSGVGEASFQCIVPPYIDDHAPPSKRGLWLSAFYLNIPFGTAVGYAYGGAVAEALSWRWMFLLEAIPMVPLIVIIFFLPYNKERAAVIAEVADALATDTAAAVADGDAAAKLPLVRAEAAGLNGTVVKNPSYGLSGTASPGSGGSSRKSSKAKTRSAAEEELLAGEERGEEGADSSALALAGPSAPHHLHKHLSVHGGGLHYPHHLPPTEAEVLREVRDELAVVEAATADPAPAEDTVAGPKPTFWQELRGLLSNPIYLSVVLGYAGFTAVVAGVGTFAPTFVAGLKLIESPPKASLAAGAVVSIAGIIGVPSGGWLIDWGQRKAKALLDAAKAKEAAAGAADGGLSFYSPTGTRMRVPVPPAISRSVSSLLQRPLSVGTGSGGRQGSVGSGLLHSASPRLRPTSTASASFSPGALAPAGGSVDGFALAPRAISSDSSARNPLHRPTSINGDGGSSVYAAPGAGGPYSSVAGYATSSGGSGGVGYDAAAAGGAEGGEEGILPLDAITEVEPLDEEEVASSPEIADIKLHVTLSQAVLLLSVGSVFMVAGVFATMAGLIPFLGVLAIGSILLMATTAGINLAMMAAVPPEVRSFAVGLGTLLLHALGDVPAQPIIGDLAGILAPCACVPVNPAEPEGPCKVDCNNRDASGLRYTLLATTSWLFWPVALWALAWVLTTRRSAQRRASGFYAEWEVGARRRRATTIAARGRAASEVIRKLLAAEGLGVDAAAAEAASGVGAGAGAKQPAGAGLGGKGGAVGSAGALDAYHALPSDSPRMGGARGGSLPSGGLLGPAAVPAGSGHRTGAGAVAVAVAGEHRRQGSSGVEMRPKRGSTGGTGASL